MAVTLAEEVTPAQEVAVSFYSWKEKTLVAIGLLGFFLVYLRKKVNLFFVFSAEPSFSSSTASPIIWRARSI